MIPVVYAVGERRMNQTVAGEPHIRCLWCRQVRSGSVCNMTSVLERDQCKARTARPWPQHGTETAYTQLSRAPDISFSTFAGYRCLLGARCIALCIVLFQLQIVKQYENLSHAKLTSQFEMHCAVKHVKSNSTIDTI